MPVHDTCDVLIVGGGPAGSTCARRLRQAGLDVLVLDRQRFPRDKVCAGWVTPQVFTELEIDAAEYAAGRTLQAITGFHVGLIGADTARTVRYPEPVSFGIRRCEFDHYLLRRSRARLRLGEPLTSLVPVDGGWLVNDTIRARMLVGAGGTHCPVARRLQGAPDRRPVIAAQEVELPIDQVRLGRRLDLSLIGLYFAPDLSGYGWCFVKQGYVNVGFGQYGGSGTRDAVTRFTAFLASQDIVHPDERWPWRGHAYRLLPDRRRAIVADRVVLIGDAAGLAYPESGEGIRPAVESGLLAARAIIDAAAHYTAEALAGYERQLTSRLASPRFTAAVGRMTTTLRPRIAATALSSSWFVRHVLINRWFLHAQQPALAA
jgi:geranylgeranyl reductase family protein